MNNEFEQEITGIIMLNLLFFNYKNHQSRMTENTQE